MYCDIDSNSLELNNNNKWAFTIARYVICILTVVGIKTVCILLYSVARRQRDLDVRLLSKMDRHKLVIYVILLAILYHNGEKFYADDFHLVLAAFLIIKYLDMSEKPDRYSIERILDNSLTANEVEIINENGKTKYNTKTSRSRRGSSLHSEVIEARKILKAAMTVVEGKVKRKEAEVFSDDCELYAIGLAKKLRTFTEEDRDEIMYNIDGIIISRRRAKEQNRPRCNAFVPHSSTIPFYSDIPETRTLDDRYALHSNPQSSSYNKPKTNGLNLTCGVGMACGYVQGYLDIIIPSDGMDNNGFLGKLENFQANQGVIFPVKKLFIILTKSMYSPPDLKDFNIDIGSKEVPWLEACSSFGQIVKDVAGTKNRLYSISAYKIHRPGKPPVYICAECVGSFYTFYKVMKNTILYEELANVCVEDIVSDFALMLHKVLPKSFELKDKIELIYFDDQKGLNLADVLLDRVKELVPDFEDLITRRY